MRTIPRILVAVIAVMLIAPTAAAADQGKGSGDGHPAVVPAVNVGGNTGGALVGDWYAQNLALPAKKSPFGGTDNLCLNLGRHGRVLSPAGGLEVNKTIEMSCTVEVGRPVLMVMTSADCSSAEPPDYFGGTAAEQRACAVNFVKTTLVITSITVSVDGSRPVDIHSPRFFAVSPQRHTVFDADPVFGATPGPATFVAAGWIAEIRGMHRGHHVVVAKATIKGYDLIPFIVHFNVVGGGPGE